MVGFGVFLRSTGTRCYTHCGLTLEFCLEASQLSIGTKFGGKISDIEVPQNPVTISKIGFKPTKLQEGTYL